jgi:hypothetical protein
MIRKNSKSLAKLIRNSSQVFSIVISSSNFKKNLDFSVLPGNHRFIRGRAKELNQLSNKNPKANRSKTEFVDKWLRRSPTPEKIEGMHGISQSSISLKEQNRDKLTGLISKIQDLQSKTKTIKKNVKKSSKILKQNSNTTKTNKFPYIHLLEKKIR